MKITMPHIKYFIAVVLIALFAATPISAQKGKKREKRESEEKKETEYDRIFKDKEHKKAEGFITLHKVEGEVYLEIPEEAFGKDMLFGATVVNVSDSHESSSGAQPVEPIHVVFGKTDSLVQIKQIRSHYKVGEGDTEIRRALERGNKPAIIASFPRVAYNSDSTALVCKATSFFDGTNDLLMPRDNQAFANYFGYVTRSYSFNESSSYIDDVCAYEENVAILTMLTFKVTRHFLGAIQVGEPFPLTAKVRASFMLLGEPMPNSREADLRVGTSTSRYLKYSSTKQKAEVKYFANRWRVEQEEGAGKDAVEPKQKIVFYVDSSFPDKLKPYIEKGVLVWNEAFEKAGYKNAIEVVHPTAEEMPELYDLNYSTIRYSPSPAKDIRSTIWTDPRSGEILSANIHIDHNAFQEIQVERFIWTGAADPRARKINIGEELLGESLTNKIAYNVGLCLGLIPNLGGSQTIPTDSLKSADFTTQYGLSASIMDRLPLNYVANSSDVARGAKLCQTTLGEYDKYAINWLYNPAEVEVENRGAKRFLREQPAAYSLDPRASQGDLGDDQIRAAQYGIENMKVVLSSANEWLAAEDTDFSYREKLMEHTIHYYYDFLTPIIKNIGGLYLNAAYAGDKTPAYVSVSKEEQQKALLWVMESLNSLEWFDNDELILGTSLNPNPSAYLCKEMFGFVLNRTTQMNVAATVGEVSYGQHDALSDIMNLLWNVKKSTNLTNTMALQEAFVEHLIKQAGYDEQSKKKSANSRALTLTDAEQESPIAFGTISSISYYKEGEDKYQMYGVLIDCQKLIKRSLNSITNPKLRGHYNFLIRKIDVALEQND